MSNNTANDDGGLLIEATASITNSKISSNATNSGAGGGLAVTAGTATIVTTEFSGNPRRRMEAGPKSQPPLPPTSQAQPSPPTAQAVQVAGLMTADLRHGDGQHLSVEQRF